MRQLQDPGFPIMREVPMSTPAVRDGDGRGAALAPAGWSSLSNRPSGERDEPLPLGLGGGLGRTGPGPRSGGRPWATIWTDLGGGCLRARAARAAGLLALIVSAVVFGVPPGAAYWPLPDCGHAPRPPRRSRRPSPTSASGCGRRSNTSQEPDPGDRPRLPSRHSSGHSESSTPSAGPGTSISSDSSPGGSRPPAGAGPRPGWRSPRPSGSRPCATPSPEDCGSPGSFLLPPGTTRTWTSQAG